MEKEKCKALNKDGTPCDAYSLSDSIYCWAHEPSLEDKRSFARSLGGARTKYSQGIPASLGNIDDVLVIVSEVIGNLKNMDISLTQAKALLSACETAMKALEYRELAERVKLLEQSLLEK